MSDFEPDNDPDAETDRMMPDPKRALELADLRTVMALKEGRRFVWRLLNVKSGILTSSYAQNANDMAFNEGMRNVGLKTIRDIDEACRDMHLLMLRESTEIEGMTALKSNPNDDE